MQKLIHLKISPISHAFYSCKTRLKKIPIVMYYLFRSKLPCRWPWCWNDLFNDSLCTLRLFHLPAVKKITKQTKAANFMMHTDVFCSWCYPEQLLSLQSRAAERSSVPRAAARSTRCVCFELALGHAGSELVSCLRHDQCETLMRPHHPHFDEIVYSPTLAYVWHWRVGCDVGAFIYFFIQIQLIPFQPKSFMCWVT